MLNIITSTNKCTPNEYARKMFWHLASLGYDCASLDDIISSILKLRCRDSFTGIWAPATGKPMNARWRGRLYIEIVEAVADARYVNELSQIVIGITYLNGLISTEAGIESGNDNDGQVSEMKIDEKSIANMKRSTMPKHTAAERSNTLKGLMFDSDIITILKDMYAVKGVQPTDTMMKNIMAYDTISHVEKDSTYEITTQDGDVFEIFETLRPLDLGAPHSLDADGNNRGVMTCYLPAKAVVADKSEKTLPFLYTSDKKCSKEMTEIFRSMNPLNKRLHGMVKKILSFGRLTGFDQVSICMVSDKQVGDGTTLLSESSTLARCLRAEYGSNQDNFQWIGSNVRKSELSDWNNLLRLKAVQGKLRIVPQTVIDAVATRNGMKRGVEAIASEGACKLGCPSFIEEVGINNLEDSFKEARIGFAEAFMGMWGNALAPVMKKVIVRGMNDIIACMNDIDAIRDKVWYPMYQIISGECLGEVKDKEFYLSKKLLGYHNYSLEKAFKENINAITKKTLKVKLSDCGIEAIEFVGFVDQAIEGFDVIPVADEVVVAGNISKSIKAKMAKMEIPLLSDERGYYVWAVLTKHPVAPSSIRQVKIRFNDAGMTGIFVDPYWAKSMAIDFDSDRVQIMIYKPRRQLKAGELVDSRISTALGVEKSKGVEAHRNMSMIRQDRKISDGTVATCSYAVSVLLALLGNGIFEAKNINHYNTLQTIWQMSIDLQKHNRKAVLMGVCSEWLRTNRYFAAANAIDSYIGEIDLPISNNLKPSIITKEGYVEFTDRLFVNEKDYNLSVVSIVNSAVKFTVQAIKDQLVGYTNGSIPQHPAKAILALGKRKANDMEFSIRCDWQNDFVKAVRAFIADPTMCLADTGDVDKKGKAVQKPQKVSWKSPMLVGITSVECFDVLTPAFPVGGSEMIQYAKNNIKWDRFDSKFNELKAANPQFDDADIREAAMYISLEYIEIVRLTDAKVKDFKAAELIVDRIYDTLGEDLTFLACCDLMSAAKSTPIRNRIQFAFDTYLKANDIAGEHKTPLSIRFFAKIAEIWVNNGTEEEADWVWKYSMAHMIADENGRSYPDPNAPPEPKTYNAYLFGNVVADIKSVEKELDNKVAEGYSVTVIPSDFQSKNEELKTLITEKYKYLSAVEWKALNKLPDVALVSWDNIPEKENKKTATAVNIEAIKAKGVPVVSLTPLVT